MFKKVFAKPLTLRIGEQSVGFDSISELDFFLSGRTGLRAVRIMKLIDAGDETLLKEIEGIAHAEQHLSGVLCGSVTDDSAVEAFFKELDLSAISQDNDWRAIMNALYAQDSSANAYKKTGLVKYLQYLGDRRQVVQKLYATRQRSQTHDGGRGFATRREGDSRFNETMLFDLTTLVPAAKEDDFSRLPKGETIDIPFQPNQSLTVMLAKHPFCIVSTDRFRFVDDNGNDKVLEEGRNVVGRDTSSDVVVDPGYRDVSRRHLIVETEGTDLIRLTDISSLGTSVPPEYLDKTLV